MLDEPAAEQSDSALLHLQLRAISKTSSAKATVVSIHLLFYHRNKYKALEILRIKTVKIKAKQNWETWPNVNIHFWSVLQLMSWEMFWDSFDKGRNINHLTHKSCQSVENFKKGICLLLFFLFNPN